MSDLPKILFIGDYNRTDYLTLLSETKDVVSFYFLFYASPKEEINKDYKIYGQAIYWQDFPDVFALLHNVQPIKVVFLYIESYNHVLLNLACRNEGIPTYQLEHGLRADYVVGFDPAISPKLPDTFSIKTIKFKNLILNSFSRIKNRLFLLKSINLLPKEDADFVKHFIKVRREFNFLETSRKIPSSKRIADYYISFSKNIYKLLQKEDSLLPIKVGSHIGIPYFDHLANITASDPIKAILFIDQPLAEQGLLGWSLPYKTRFAEELASICRNLGFKLLVKPHPMQDLAVWQRIAKSYNIKLIADNELIQLIPQIRVVFGFYSTYLLPFAALKHTTLITYENHPAGKLMVSQVFIEAGVGHAIFNLQELNTLLTAIENLHREQAPFKPKFVEDWLYKFDGKSGIRLKNLLLAGL